MKRERTRLERDGTIVLALVVLHQVLKLAFADGAIGRALYSPDVTRSIPTVLLGILLVNVRVLLLVGVPGILGAALARGLVQRLRLGKIP